MIKYLWVFVFLSTTVIGASRTQIAEDSSIVFPLKTSKNGRHLTDQKGTPFLIVADVAWELPRKVDASDLSLYLDTRKKQFFNTILVQALPSSPNQNFGADQNPFLQKNDLKKPNTKYFSQLDKIVSEAKKRGLVVGINLFSKEWTEVFNKQGVHATQAYITFLCKQMEFHQNIIWLVPSINSFNSEFTKAIIEGLKLGKSNAKIIASLSTQFPLPTSSNQDSKIDMDFFIPDSTVSVSAYLSHMDTQKNQHLKSKKPFVISNVELTANIKDQSLLFRNHIYKGVLNFSAGFCHSSTIRNFNPTWKQNLNKDGSEYVKHFVKIIGKLPWEFMRPNLDMKFIKSHPKDTDITCTFINNNKMVLMYASSSASFTIDTKILGYPSYSVIWYSPRTGKRWIQNNILPQANTTLTPPESQIGWDWVILIGGKI